jgi:hypothetical protein
MKVKKQTAAVVGVAEHGNSAELVTLSAADVSLLDRRRIDLTEGLPTQPYHHEGAWAVGRYKDSAWARDVTLDEAIELVQQVQAAAAKGAAAGLENLASALAMPIERIAIRACAKLPATIEERIRDNRAQTMADSITYRQALAQAARDRGWSVVWYEKKQVAEEAAAALAGESLDTALKAMGKSAGPPWQARHKLAAAAALAALRSA